LTALIWLVFAGLAVAAVGFIVWPLVRSVPSEHMDRRTAALAAHRARLLEIEEGESDGAPPGSDIGREARADDDESGEDSDDSSGAATGGGDTSAGSGSSSGGGSSG